MQRPLPAEESALSIKTCHTSSEPDGEHSAPWSVLCSVALTLMWEPSGYIALSLRDTDTHSPFTQDVFIALSAASEFQTWPSPLPGTTFPYNLNVPAPESEVSPHPFLRLTEFSGSKQVLFLSEEEKKTTHTQTVLYDGKVCFCFLISLEAMTSLGHGLMILINLTSFFDQYCFSICFSNHFLSSPHHSKTISKFFAHTLGSHMKESFKRG